MNDFTLQHGPGALYQATYGKTVTEGETALKRTTEPASEELVVGLGGRPKGTISNLIKLKLDDAEVDPQQLRASIENGLSSAIQVATTHTDQVQQGLEARIMEYSAGLLETIGYQTMLDRNPTLDGRVSLRLRTAPLTADDPVVQALGPEFAQQALLNGIFRQLERTLWHSGYVIRNDGRSPPLLTIEANPTEAAQISGRFERDKPPSAPPIPKEDLVAAFKAGQAKAKVDAERLASVAKFIAAEILAQVTVKLRLAKDNGVELFTYSDEPARGDSSGPPKFNLHFEPNLKDLPASFQEDYHWAFGSDALHRQVRRLLETGIDQEFQDVAVNLIEDKSVLFEKRYVPPVGADRLERFPRPRARW